jgi:signal transduction histidine kinase
MPDREHRHPHGPGFRPPWWPEDESFPSRDRLREMRAHFLRRIVLTLGVFILVVFLLGWLSAGFGRGHFGAGPSPRGVFFILALLAMGFVLFGRVVRRTAGPIGNVMDAAGRVADGEYSARAPIEGPSDVQDLALAFNRMAERLESNERQRRDLLADVAHELRTPLTVIQGRLEGIADGVYPLDLEHLSLIERETKVMSRLLNDLQLLSKAEAGVLELHREEVAPGALIEEAVSAHRSLTDEANVEITTAIAQGLPALVADRVRLGEVLSNLVTNAIRHTPAGGRITLIASRTDVGVAFAVEDTGDGSPPEQLALVFDRFAKAPESRGAGLGLAIAKSLVQAHGGTISAESDPGRGTTIRFVLPAD